MSISAIQIIVSGSVVQPAFSAYLAGEEGFEPSHAGIKIQCLNQLGDSPTRVGSYGLTTGKSSLAAHPSSG